MRRKGIYRPTIEDAVEISGIETLHPGGFALTRRAAEVGGLRTRDLRVLDVSSGRGTQSVFYAQEYGAEVTGIDIAPEMVEAATTRAEAAGLGNKVTFRQGDSQALPFPDASFDVVINECAVGIPDDSQRVLEEMVRVVRPGGTVVIHESTWNAPMPADEKDEIAERYGTTPLEHDEWMAMLSRAGAVDLQSELEPWSEPERFWKVRKDRDVSGPGRVLSIRERLSTVWRIARAYGARGVLTAIRNERIFYRTVLDGKLGYGLYWGRRPTAINSRRQLLRQDSNLQPSG